MSRAGTVVVAAVVTVVASEAFTVVAIVAMAVVVAAEVVATVEVIVAVVTVVQLSLLPLRVLLFAFALKAQSGGQSTSDSRLSVLELCCALQMPSPDFEALRPSARDVPDVDLGRAPAASSTGRSPRRP